MIYKSTPQIMGFNFPYIKSVDSHWYIQNMHYVFYIQPFGKRMKLFSQYAGWSFQTGHHLDLVIDAIYSSPYFLPKRKIMKPDLWKYSAISRMAIKFKILMETRVHSYSDIRFNVKCWELLF